MKKLQRLIVKVKSRYLLINDGLSINIKDCIREDNPLKNLYFIPAMPDSFIRNNNKNNKVNTKSLVGIYYACIKKEMNEEQLNATINALSMLPYFDYIQKIPETSPLPPAVSINNTFCDSPNFTHYQDYKYGNRGHYYGIDMMYAWSLGIAGQGVRIAVIDWGFNFNHIDLKSARFVELIPLSKHEFDYHGTNVVGVLYAKNNESGITGMVYDADVVYGVTEFTEGYSTRPTNIAIGLEQLRAGDVFLFEMQEYYGEPADYNKAIWDMIKAATDAGIIVVATAGNGNWDLDSEQFADYRSWGDNGVIMVGAGTKIGRNKCSFSNYGTRVHVQGWGDWTVVTTGIGDLYDGVPAGDNDYTHTFAGTSSAGAIVTSAVVAIQSWYKRATNHVLYPLEMRNLLIETGLAQGNEVRGHIGALPNIRNAIEKLKRVIIYFDIKNDEDIYANDIKGYLQEHEVVIINLSDSEWSESIFIPTASLLNKTKRIYINNNSQYTSEVYLNFSDNPRFLKKNESILLVSDGQEWRNR
ncbi:S8 family serine peptidase [Providencia vermicola]|uniref:S8 family serine peptidase n=1 Tax=Providencia stuartii TaxID=588 RepID=A0AAI9I3N8_PROST|nr:MULTISPECIES: S8 family serine peptidase [Providencia]ELR5045593.1 S8 family serine peptidase [Providencia rettgeri]ELR5037713.1 S8 family serine peptidase [Providencia stuartii]ELR5292268.1 S8 family serine peptidase [Providencia stuartii]MCR4180041.1 S8 family serine peptidase [Providencia vermicola]URE77134.1 S8 family serine peptidase [Providencia stuartii]